MCREALGSGGTTRYLEPDFFLAKLFGLRPYESDPEQESWNCKFDKILSIKRNIYIFIYLYFIHYYFYILLYIVIHIFYILLYIYFFIYIIISSYRMRRRRRRRQDVG